MTDFVQMYLIHGVLTAQCICEQDHPHVRCTNSLNGPDGLCSYCRSNHYGHVDFGPIVATPCTHFGMHRVGCGNYADGEDGLCTACREYEEARSYIDENAFRLVHEGDCSQADEQPAVVSIGGTLFCITCADNLYPEWRELTRDQVVTQPQHQYQAPYPDFQTFM